MNNMTEYLSQLEELTNTNLELLRALNNSFYTKAEHLAVKVNNSDYTIPSFLYLENKINALEGDFYNLVNAPKTGEAAFNFNGNTQLIEMKGFTNTPVKAFEGVDMNTYAATIKQFGANANAVFKDFMTPTPYVKLDLSQLPDDILMVNVKKVTIKNDDLLGLLHNAAGWVDGDTCKPVTYSDALKKMYAYEAGVDYIEYDKTYTLPIRDKIGSGKYSIQSIIRNWTDPDFTEHYVLKVDTLAYYIADETIQRVLAAGDYLVTNNDRIKLYIENVDTSSNTLTVSVLENGYADLMDASSGSVDLSTLKYFSKEDVTPFKYVNVPLEEDRNIMVFVAPVQRNSLIQSAWGEGFIFDVYNLMYDEDNNVAFKTYYDNAVTNIGDKLFGVVGMLSDDFINMLPSEYSLMSNAKPVIDTEAIKVTQINKHLNNSDTIEEIYAIYKEKTDNKSKLTNVQNEIDAITATLNAQSFADVSSDRKVYEDQLTNLTAQKRSLVASINDCITRLTQAVTDSDTPVDNPKYRIRGFFDYSSFLSLNSITGHDAIKIEVQYRYKNANKVTGNAETIGEDALFSDWCVMESGYRWRTPAPNGVSYTFKLQPDNTSINEPSFNQIDIPITQGETVDIRLRVVYSTGFPFVYFTSAWSDVTNIAFPDEFKQNITVLGIIEENNGDAKESAFQIKMDQSGVTDHVNDKLIDQNITFYHQPEHIASGFYTNERRVIPLKDKLQSLTDDIVSLQDEVYGTGSNSLQVTISDNTQTQIVIPFATNSFTLPEWSSSEKIKENETATSAVMQSLALTLTNVSKHDVKLFSIFPGDVTQHVGASLPASKYNNHDYNNGDMFVPIVLNTSDSVGLALDTQHQNQWVYFRINNPYNGVVYYTKDVSHPSQVWPKNNLLYTTNLSGITSLNLTALGYVIGASITSSSSAPSYAHGGLGQSSYFGAALYCNLNSYNDLCINNSNSSNYQLLRPGESLLIPLVMTYNCDNLSTIKKTVSFDIRTSLFDDLTNYTITLVANKNNPLSQKSVTTVKNKVYSCGSIGYSPVVIN